MKRMIPPNSLNKCNVGVKLTFALSLIFKTCPPGTKAEQVHLAHPLSTYAALQIHTFTSLPTSSSLQANKSVFKAHTAELRCSYVGLLEDLLEEVPEVETADSNDTKHVLTRPIVSRGEQN